MPGQPRHIGATVCTNNTAELTALYVGLRFLEYSQTARATIQFDSSYAAGVCQRTLRARKNLELVKRVRLTFERLSTQVTWQKVKSHSGHPLNEQADALARCGMQGLQLGNLDAFF